MNAGHHLTTVLCHAFLTFEGFGYPAAKPCRHLIRQLATGKAALLSGHVCPINYAGKATPATKSRPMF